MVQVPNIPPGGGGPSPSNPWAPGEMPPGPPMPVNSPWVQYMVKMFPNQDPGVLAEYASRLMSNMMQMLGTQISNDTKKAHEAAQKMKQAILGQD